jgi:hypothetical protein
MGLQVALTAREFSLASALLATLGALAYAAHVRHGGFYLDDWSNAAGVLRPRAGRSFSNALSYSWGLTAYRPVLVLYVPLTYFVFGTHMAYLLAWATILGIFAAAMLYGVLRTLGVPWIHAWLIAALTIVYPWSDSTRLWSTASLLTLAIGFAFSGLWLALQGIHRRSWPMHVCAAVLYLMSIWTYEITLPLIAVAGGLYTIVVGWRAARMRWLFDVVVVIVGGLWVGLNTKQESFGFSADLRHLKEIIVSGGTILGRSLLPVGEQRTALALVIVGLITLIGLAMFMLLRARRGVVAASSLRGWVLLAAGGLLVAALGWVMFIPANPYFTPSVYGVTNRVNALPAFGLVMAVYAMLGIVGELVARLLPKSQRLAVPTTVLLGVLLGAAYVGVLERHIKIWDAAYRAESAGIGEMRMQLPRIPSGATVFTSDYPAYQTLGVPIFSAYWDVNGMIKLQYKNGTLSAYPILSGLRLECRAASVALVGVGQSVMVARYGAAWFLNIHSGEHARPRSEPECRAVAGNYTPGPIYLSYGY